MCNTGMLMLNGTLSLLLHFQIPVTDTHVRWDALENRCVAAAGPSIEKPL